MTAYLVYDVFTDAAFGGNQLAVIPDAAALPEHQLQKIAREFNFSETTFVFPPADPKHTARVRIFTPTMEVPFAGHPTIGTAVALAALGHVGPMTLELGIGPIACVADPNAASFTTFARLERLASPDVALVAAALGLRVEEISLATHAPIQASIGLPFVLAEVADQVTLSRCQPDVASMRKGAALHPAGLDFAIFAYCREGDDVHARMFAPLDNIPEDPATGSAAATLAALLTEVLGAPVDLIIRQGTDMGRPSLISARTKAGDPVPVIISGKAVNTMEGRLVV